jgi:Ethylene-responsive protein kinase Le-CTR1
MQDKKLKELFPTIPSLDELQSLGMDGLKADIILVDTEKDKKLCMLKQLSAAFKGLSSNPALVIKKIASLVRFYWPKEEFNMAHEK